jgi:hypothetical protein
LTPTGERLCVGNAQRGAVAPGAVIKPFRRRISPMVCFQDLVMNNNAAEKWASSSIDIRVVLNMAFSDALMRPKLTTYYAERYVRLPDMTICLFGFRIGYASFILMLVDGTDEFIVVDFAYNDGDEARAEMHYTV